MGKPPRKGGSRAAPTPPCAYDLEAIRAIYPFAQHRLEVPGGFINYVDEGTGPAVVMLHGNPTWSFF
jgi:haloalkane dehalogenase